MAQPAAKKLSVSPWFSWENIVIALVFVAAIVFWKLYTVWFGVPAFLLPPPEAVGRELTRLVTTGQIWPHLGTTLFEVVVGFFLGSSVGLVGGYILAKLPRFKEVLDPYILFAQTAPKIALIPLFVMWFGLGMTSKLILVFSMVFFPVLVNTMLGLQSVDTNYYHLMKVIRANKWQTFFSMELPHSLPLIFAGLRLGMIQAVIGAIVAEWISGKSGLGYLLVYGSTTYRSNLLFAAIILTNVLGIACYQAVAIVERRLLHWHDSQSVDANQ